MKKAKCIAGTVWQRMPQQDVADAGAFERIRRLSFDVQEPRSLIPTLITREGSGSGNGVRVPRRALMVAPMLNLAQACANSGTPTGPPVPPPPRRIDAAGVSLPGHAPGYKERNQDSAVLVDSFLSGRQQLLAVLDGHGPEGHRVSGFVAANLPFTLLSALVDSNNTDGGAAGGGGAGQRPVQRALAAAVASLDSQLAGSGIDVDDSGTTAALCHVHGRRLTAAWLGDSRMLLGLPGPAAAAAAAGAGAGAAGAAAGSAASGVAPGPAGSSDGSGGGGWAWGRGGGGGGGGGGAGSGGGDADGRAGQRKRQQQLDGGGDADEVRGGGASGASGSGSGGGGGGWRVAWCSVDHKPELREERERIEAAGGRVARSGGPGGPVGPYRVWFKDQPYPGLAMSRALGDLPGRRIGVSATPSLASLALPDRGPALLVLASDGVWELLDNQQVLDLAAGAGSAAEAASRVAHQSRRAWVKEYGGSYIDDITAIVVRFDMPPEEEGRA